MRYSKRCYTKRMKYYLRRKMLGFESEKLHIVFEQPCRMHVCMYDTILFQFEFYERMDACLFGSCSKHKEAALYLVPRLFAKTPPQSTMTIRSELLVHMMYPY